MTHRGSYFDLNGIVHPVFCPRNGQGSALGKTDSQLAKELFEKVTLVRYPSTHLNLMAAAARLDRRICSPPASHLCGT